MKLSKALDKFIEYQLVCGHSDKTINYYKQTITYFINFTSDIDINCIDVSFYNNYVIYLRNKNVVNNGIEKSKKLSADTIRNRTIAIKAFFNYLYSAHYIKINIFEGVKNFKYGKKVISVLSNSQILEILSYYDEDTFLGSRNLLIISLFLDSGLRLSEVVGLDVSNILFNMNCIKVLGKGNRERYVPLSLTTKKYFLKYRNFYSAVSGPLLVDEKFNPIKNSCISDFFCVLRKDLGFQKLHPHFLRHTFATLFLINGGDPLSLQTILGHTTLTMTEKYVHIANQLMISGQSRFSPLSNL